MNDENDVNRRQRRKQRVVDVLLLPVRVVVLLLVFAPVTFVLTVLQVIGEWAEGLCDRCWRLLREWRFMASAKGYETLLEQERRINVLKADQRAREARMDAMAEELGSARGEVKRLKDVASKQEALIEAVAGLGRAIGGAEDALPDRALVRIEMEAGEAPKVVVVHRPREASFWEEQIEDVGDLEEMVCMAITRACDEVKLEGVEEGRVD